MNIGLVIILIILGLICLILEILVVPGAIVGIIGCLMMAGGIVLAYVELGTLAGNITLISTLMVTIAAVVIILRSKTWRKLMLKTEIDGKMNEINEEKIQIGMEGITVSRLAPMGKGKFEGETVEVSSILGFVDENQTIIITKIEGNKIYVKLKS